MVALPTVRFMGTEIRSSSGRSWGADVPATPDLWVRVLIQIRVEDVVDEGSHRPEAVVGQVDLPDGARLWATGPTPQVVADDLAAILERRLRDEVARG